ncbi:MAG: tetratricopeptide repeat protein, partial [Elusimicrobiota bacterium]
ASFREAIAVSDLVDAHNDLGLVLLRTGRVEEALRAWSYVVEKKDPAYAPAYFNLGLAYEQAGRAEDARRAVGAYASLTPDPAERRRAIDWMERLKKK